VKFIPAALRNKVEKIEEPIEVAKKEEPVVNVPGKNLAFAKMF